MDIIPPSCWDERSFDGDWQIVLLANDMRDSGIFTHCLTMVGTVGRLACICWQGSEPKGDQGGPHDVAGLHAHHTTVG